MANRDSIKVVCRVRPENQIELSGNYQRCVEHTDKDIKVNVSNGSYLHMLSFHFVLNFSDVDWYRLFPRVMSVMQLAHINFHSIGFLEGIVPRLKSLRK